MPTHNNIEFLIIIYLSLLDTIIIYVYKMKMINAWDEWKTNELNLPTKFRMV